MENWKDIDGYEGLYQVSDFGRIKSLERVTELKNGAKRLVSEKIRKLSNHKVAGKNGYLIVGLSKNNITKSMLVHIIVAKSFIKNPHSKPQVNHKNGIKSDNRVSNLEWVTASENQKHALKMGLQIIPSGSASPMYGRTGGLNNSSKKIIQIDDNKIVQKFNSIVEASLKTKIEPTNISACCRKKRKKAGGYKWEFDSNTN